MRSDSERLLRVQSQSMWRTLGQTSPAETSVIKAYRTEMLGKESYVYLGRPSFTLRCPEPGCTQEYGVYLESEESESAARNLLDRRLGQDHEAGQTHPNAVYIP